MLIAAEVFVPLRLFACPASLDTGQARIWRWLSQSARQSEFFKNSDWRKQYGVQQSQRRKEMAAMERSRRKQLRSLGVSEKDIESSVFTIGRFSIPTGVTISVCKKQVHTLKKSQRI